MIKNHAFRDVLEILFAEFCSSEFCTEVWIYFGTISNYFNDNTLYIGKNNPSFNLVAVVELLTKLLHVFLDRFCCVNEFPFLDDNTNFNFIWPHHMQFISRHWFPHFFFCEPILAEKFSPWKQIKAKREDHMIRSNASERPNAPWGDIV